MKKDLLISIVAAMTSSLTTSALLVHVDISAGLASILGTFATAAIVAITLVLTNK